MKHTPGPWEIHWYNCTMDQNDVEHAKSNGNLSAKVGDVLWRAPRSIGPCGIEHSHWGGDLLTVEEADAHLIATAPDMLEFAKAVVQYAGLGGDDYLADKARALIAKATGGKE